MTLKSLRVASFSIEDLVDLIFDDTELWNEIRKNANNATKLRMNSKKFAREQLTTDSKKAFLEFLGFEEIQESRYRLKGIKKKNKK